MCTVDLPAWSSGGRTLNNPILRRRNLKTNQSAVILDFCLGKPRTGKSRDYRDVIVFDELCFQKTVFRLH